MTDSNLTVARLVGDQIDGIEIKGDPFEDLRDALGVAPKVESQHIVTSEKTDEANRAYIVRVHIVPGMDGTTRVYACTCPGFRFHRLPATEEIESDPEAGFESIGRCKHGDEVAVKTRMTADREDGQQGFEAFSNESNEKNDNDTED